MQLISTNRSYRCRRGTAEVEAALIIPILLGILFLIGYLGTRGRAELAGAYNAENNAYTQVVSGTDLNPSTDPLPIDGGINLIRPPALPNRFDYAQPTGTFTTTILGEVVSKRIDDKAVFLDPAWQYSATPNTGDRPQIQDWFEQYVLEARTPQLIQSLGLRPPGPP